MIQIQVTYNHMMFILHYTHLGQWTTFNIYLKLLTPFNFFINSLTPPSLADLK